MSRNFEGEDQATERTLTVTNYSEERDEEGNRIKTNVAIAPHNVDFVIGSEEMYDIAEGTELRKVNVIFTSGNNLEVYITLIDLMSIQRAISTYFLP